MVRRLFHSLGFSLATAMANFTVCYSSWSNEVNKLATPCYFLRVDQESLFLDSILKLVVK